MDGAEASYNISTAAPAGRSPGGPPIAGVDGNWKCNMCGNVNFAIREACNRCQAPRSAAEAPTFGAPAFGGCTGGGKGKGKGPPVAGVDGNWACPGCGNVNFAMREFCNRCQAPKPKEDQFASFESFDAWGENAGADGGLLEQLLQSDDGQPAKRLKM